MAASILVIAAHPDDEVLGCGGTIVKHTQAGDEVNVLIVAEGSTSRLQKRDRSQVSDQLSALSQAAQKASSIMGVNELELMDLPDNRLDSLDRLDLIKHVEARIDRFKPSVVYFHHVGDVNIDHQRIHEAVITACRPFPGQPVKQLLTFEVASSTEWQSPFSAPVFQPNWFIDISDEWSYKLQALQAYSLEMRKWPHARSCEAVEHLARWRGSQVGLKAAEAFCLLRNIQ